MNALKKGLHVLLNDGILTFAYKVKNKYIHKNSIYSPYNRWINVNEKNICEIDELKYQPLISVIVPVYNVNERQLIECIESVRKQIYHNWELCIVDDASTMECVKKTLKKYENIEKVKIHYRIENGHIARATNDGIKLSYGEFIAFLDCDDTLSPNALYEMVKKLNENPEYDFIYSDEDKITEDGKRRHTPFFKPDWSPDTFFSLMYTCHFSLYRKSIAIEIGGIRVGFEGAQDYDFTLRFTEKTNNIGHIPLILYHWRERKESTSLNIQSKPYVFEATKKAKEEAISRRGLNASLEFVDEINQYRVKYINNKMPKVSIIIPSKDNFVIFSRCINSIKKLTDYKNYEIVVVDNGSSEDNRKLYKDFCNLNNCLYHYHKMEFNFSKMCNMGSKLASGLFFLFLNDDIEIISSDWINLMLGHASLSYVGAVGAKLYYPNSNIIQHAGVINLEVGPSHSLLGVSDIAQYYFCRNKIEYNFIAVTGACLLIEKCKFENLNGFDETFPVAYNDIDLCFRLVKNGFYNVIRNDVTLYHHESISRGYDLEDASKTKRLKDELERLYIKYPEFKHRDPFYNPNLVQDGIDYSINCSPEIINNKVKRVKCKISKFNKMSNIINYIDSINTSDNVSVEGWSFLQRVLFSNLTIKKIILVSDDGNVYIIKTNTVYRPDVTIAFGNKKNRNFCGFRCEFSKNLIKCGRYKVYISLRNILTNEKFIDTNKIIEIK